MKFQMSFETLAIILTVIHFIIPLTYYGYVKGRWLSKPWRVNLNPNHQPLITVILPTYNEAKIIQNRLENIYSQDYPREKWS